jgi:hypothetical protein
MGWSGFVVRVVDTLLDEMTRLLVAGRFEIVLVVWIARDIRSEKGSRYIHHPSVASLILYSFQLTAT